MSNFPQTAFESASLRLETLVKLRWAAIFGQFAAVFIVYFVFGYDLKFVWCVAVITLSVWLNIFLTVRFKANHRIGNIPATYLLAYDIFQLCALLFLTGGLQNPFSIFLLAPTTIAAGSLLFPQLLALNLLAICCASFLAFYHFPLPWKDGENLAISNIYIFGIWTALLVSMAFFGAYAWRVAQERRFMNEALIASEMVLAREQKLSALDGMAAAMAHELGTPLSTINVAAKEMFKDKEKYREISEDIELIYSQSLKCREVLQKIGRENSEDEVLSHMNIGVLITELIDTHQKGGVDINTDMSFTEDSDKKNKYIFQRNPAIIYGLGNILSNAVRFAHQTVQISAKVSEEGMFIEIEDDGPGFASEIIEYLGEPTLPKISQKQKMPDTEKSNQGLGLGLFIAKTFLERSGARLSFMNRSKPLKGARVAIAWDKTIFSIKTDA